MSTPDEEDIAVGHADYWQIALRDDQWDLIVLALQRIRKMANGDATFHIDLLAREFLRHRVDETIAEIKAIVEGAGEK